MDEENDFSYLPFVTLDQYGNETGRHKTEKVAIDCAKDEASYDNETVYVARVIGVAKPAAQPVTYVPYRNKAKVTARKRPPRAIHQTKGK